MPTLLGIRRIDDSRTQISQRLPKMLEGFGMRKFLYLSTISGFIISLDQLTKMIIHTSYQLGESITVIPGFFDITYVRNLGAAFGFLAKSHPEFRETFFLLMPPAALIIILLILKTVENSDRIQIFALSCVFGGAIGNYIDRLRFRYVIDFLDFHYQGYRWPAFNVADISIVCGVSILLLLMVLQKKKEAETSAKT